MKKSEIFAISIRATIAAMVVFSIIVTYYVKVVQKDYVIFTNPEGPETEDYFDELFAE